MADREVGHRFFIIFGVKRNEIIIVLCSTIRNFAIKMAKLLRLDKKRNSFLCFVLDYS